jgi:hypothetical protein
MSQFQAAPLPSRWKWATLNFETAGDRGILGRWRHGSALERSGFGDPLGSLRTAEGGKSGINV